MCHVSCIVFGSMNLSREEIVGRTVIEVGSCDVNGSLRPILESWGPAKYIGVDIEEGPGVDLICNAENLVERFGKESFDIVISTELLEHTKNWSKVISNIKNICKPNGKILITTRSKGFRYHEFPFDYWRFELEDMKNIFSDCEILILEKDPQEPGVFVKLRKPSEFVENDLSSYKLYSVAVNKDLREIDGVDPSSPSFIRSVRKERIKNRVFRIIESVLSKI
jgi:SAM-dependent methyltransferase